MLYDRVKVQAPRQTDVLFVAHVPPPWTGQGVIHQMLLEGKYSDVHLLHLPMLFSKQSAGQGKFSAAKVFSLLQLIANSYTARFQKGIVFLYFSPGGPSLSAVLRDGIYLLTVRPIMRGTMLVYHSSGVAEYLEKLPAVIRPLIRKGFSSVELAIQLSLTTPPDGPALLAKETRIIPNSVPDDAGSWFPRVSNSVLKILYMGVVALGKGVLDLLLAAHKLSERGIQFEIVLAGSFISDEEESKLRETSRGLPTDSVKFVGPLSGEVKREAFRSNDVFCFPSFWYTETFPLVLLEALCFGMPIVASRWRGIPDLLGMDEDCGTLVDIHAVDQIAAALEQLAVDPVLREAQSRNARLRYEQRFSMRSFFADYDAAFSDFVKQSEQKTISHRML